MASRLRALESARSASSFTKCPKSYFLTKDDIPLSGLALILGIDRIMDSARTVTNVIGNGVAAMAIAYWHGQRDDSALAAATLEPAAPAASRTA
ncbi:cation:dicarboxylase symporter family transporter [Bosea sp. (in: a-proteobacteria)]|uniref:cation:dicarboxylate symporter family transporter n=1 Tax=Bosea sp. (in: a-proteobacteria) TaxID=1871050 RepID=UPI0031FE7C69